MFLSRSFPFGLIKYQHYLITTYSRCFISNLSNASSDEKKENSHSNNQEQATSTTKLINDNNEWLWAYLRDRKTFSDLNEEQKRRVIEIGTIILH
jgi:hypothetical protein